MPSADAAAGALAATWSLLARTLEQGWAREFGRVTALVTRVPVPTLNGAWAVSEDVWLEDVDAALDAVAAERVPYCLEARPGVGGAAELAARRGMAAAGLVPLMASTAPVEAPASEALVLRELDPSEARLHCEVAGPAFGAPADLLAGVITATVLGLPEVRGYVGEVGGEPVVTAMSVTQDGGVGIFNVATPAAHRRRGYGAAVTARAAMDGLEAGAGFAWLQSTEVGYGVYERLGFATLERWGCWISPG